MWRSLWKIVRKISLTGSLYKNCCARSLWKAVCTRFLRRFVQEDLCKGSQSKISVQGISTWSPSKTSALFPKSLYKISMRGLLARSLYKISIRALLQDLCNRPLGKISVQISRRGLLARPLDKISLGKISLWDLRAFSLYKSLLGKIYVRDLGKIFATDLYAMSLYKVSIRGVLARSQISIYGVSWQDFCMRFLVLRERPQSKCTWTCHKPFYSEIYRINAARQKLAACFEQSKCTWTYRKTHFFAENTGKMPDAPTATPVSCEPARSKCKWTCHESQEDFNAEISR